MCKLSLLRHGVIVISDPHYSMALTLLFFKKHRFLRNVVPNDESETPKVTGDCGHCEEVERQAWGFNERLVKSCSDLYYPSIKTRHKITLDISLDVVLNYNKKNQIALSFPNITSTLSAGPTLQGDIFKATRVFDPRAENDHHNTGSVHPWPLLTKWRAGEMRWLEDVSVE